MPGIPLQHAAKFTVGGNYFCLWEPEREENARNQNGTKEGLSGSREAEERDKGAGRLKWHVLQF